MNPLFGIGSTVYSDEGTMTCVAIERRNGEVGVVLENEQNRVFVTADIIEESLGL